MRDMTLWGLAKKWREIAKRPGLEQAAADTYSFNACQLEQWAREKAKEWEEIADAAREDKPNTLFKDGVASGVEGCVSELGVPEEESND